MAGDLATGLERLQYGLVHKGEGLRLLIHASEPDLALGVVRGAVPAAEIYCYDSYDGFAEFGSKTNPDLCLSDRFGANNPREPWSQVPTAPFAHTLPGPVSIISCHSIPNF